MVSFGEKDKIKKAGNLNQGRSYVITTVIHPKLMSHSQNHATAQVQLQGATVEVGWSLKPPSLLQIN